MDDKLQIFGGRGFVGSEFLRQNPNCIVNERNDYTVRSRNILYLISTISNYNMLTDPYIDIDTNLTVLMKVLEQCRNQDVTFNFVSSWFVYGDTDLPAREESVCRPTGFYSITKKAAEDLLICYSKVFNIKYRILRLANIAGVGDPKAGPQKNALQFMLNQIKQNQEVKVYDGGNLIRDYIHVKDAVSAMSLVIDQGDANSIYNIGNGVACDFKYIIDYAFSKTKSTSIRTNQEPPEFHRIVQVKNMYMDNSKIRNLGYQPNWSLESTLDEMLGY